MGVTFLLLMAALSPGGGSGSWTDLSGKLAYRWDRPASNSCEVEIRDREPKGATELTIETVYLSHAQAKGAPERQAQNIVLTATGSGYVHVSNCEQIQHVSVLNQNQTPNTRKADAGRTSRSDQ